MAPGIFWTEDEKDELWRGWKSQPKGVTPKYYATQYAKTSSRGVNSVNSKLSELIRNQKEGFPVSNYTTWDKPPVVEGDALIIMDPHFPYHDAGFIDKCLSVARAWEIDTAILGGDAFDANSFNQHPDNFADDDRMVIDTRLRSQLLKMSERMKAEERTQLQDLISKTVTEDGNITEEIRETRKCLKYFENTFKKTLWIMGNHEQRIVRILEKALGVADLAKLMGTTSPRWEISAYFWAILKSGGVEWQIEHPNNSGKGSSKKLATRFNKNIVMGHGHHFSITSDPSGKYLAIEPGSCADETKMGYVSQRHSGGDKHMLGAVIIRNGFAYPLNIFTDFEFMAKIG